MTDIDYDCEFLERGPGHPVDLISIGMVADGEELYLISSEFDTFAVARHEWLMVNVVPSLPFMVRTNPVLGRVIIPARTLPDGDAFATRSQIAARVRDFVLSFPRPRLWAWYGAYDHVVLAQLFGTMAELPKGFPQHTCDLKQEADRLGNPDLPKLPGRTEHRAIDDAREVRFRREWLAQQAGGR